MSKIDSSYVPTSFYGANSELKVDKPLAEAVQADVKARLDQMPDPVADHHFLAAIADLSPEQVDTAGERKELFDKFSAAANKFSGEMQALPFTGDIAKLLGRIMIEFAGQQRQQAVEDRTLARQAAQAEMLNQAAQQEKAATELMAGAITNAVLGGVGGALSFMGSAASFAGQAKSLTQMKSAATQSAAAQKTMDGITGNAETGAQASKAATATKSARVEIDLPKPETGRNRSDAFSLGSGNTVDGKLPGSGTGKSTTVETDDAIAKLNQKEASLAEMTPSQKAEFREASAAKGVADQKFAMANSQAQIAMTFGQAIEAFGGLLKTSGQSTDGAMQAAAKHSEAQGSRDAAEAEYLKGIADGKKEIEESMGEFMKQIINFLKEMQDAEVEAMRSITRG